MIKFITNSKKHNFQGKILSEREGRRELEDFLAENNRIGKPVAKDYEATGLDAYTLKPLLLGLGNKQVQYCIDLCSINIKNWKIPSDLKYIGHNIKYDIKLEIINFNFHHKNVYDTMIAEQKIYQGCQSNPKFKFNLSAVTFRHLGIGRKHGKDTRLDFINADPKTFVFEHNHIEYLAEDLINLEAIKDSQYDYLTEYDLKNWMHGIEFPLIYHLAQCELNGFRFDTEKWQSNIDESTKIRHKLACKLDDEFRKLRDTLPKVEKSRISGGMYDRNRNFKLQQLSTNLFGTVKKVKTTKGINNINWGSDKVILYILACLKQPAPLQGSIAKKYNYLIPCLDDNLNKIVGNCGFLKRKKFSFKQTAGEGFTTGKNALTKYLIDFPKTPLRDFILILKQWREVNHEITSFGENFLEKINPITGKLHTIFRQANAVNSRFQSGGGYLESDKYNAQNIPRKKKFRHCFKGDLIFGKESSIVTCDLSGAEVAILCDKSGDKNLYKWAIEQDDTHSPMVQNVWRTIYLYRAGKLEGKWNNPKEFEKLMGKPNDLDKSKNEEVLYWYNLSKTFIVSKTKNKAYRQAGKNGTFGGLYGMKANKAAETFNGTDSELMKINPNYIPVNVTEEEGHIILLAQKSVIPDAYAYVESNVKKAFSQGYLQYDNKSKSRIWFPDVLKLFKEIEEHHEKEYNILNPQIVYLGNGKYKVIQTEERYELSYVSKKNIDGQARNVPISGTQADCIKEAIIEICNYADINNYKDIKWLSQVHDELVFSMPKRIDGQSKEYKSSKRKINFPEYVRKTMINAANRHMSRVKMGADYDVLDSWTK
tara:strand:+ start:7064 stop:9526 length:2463 start_codon:yes stop_codon:yes gene_type:complete